MSISRDFKIAVKLHDLPAYRLAQRANINPCTLSKLLSGYIDATPGDERVEAVAEVLGLDAETCFEPEEVNHG